MKNRSTPHKFVLVTSGMRSQFSSWLLWRDCTPLPSLLANLTHSRSLKRALTRKARIGTFQYLVVCNFYSLPSKNQAPMDLMDGSHVLVSCPSHEPGHTYQMVLNWIQTILGEHPSHTDGTQGQSKPGVWSYKSWIFNSPPELETITSPKGAISWP